ncbi:mucin-6-like [Larimichthys crocea]|uniref:mucin-6-like n=1 Tax=Larimichthys crocea TaxID=215358 RepID=UPI000901D1EA|nr:mucin-6-like [Larimichthys crocea]
MAILWMTLCAAFMVTVVMSKPVHLSEGEDTSESSESTESNSSEENASHVEPSQEPPQPAITETDILNAIEETGSPGTAAPTAKTAGPSMASLDTSPLPDPEDPQTSTDPLHLTPDDPSQTSLGRDISQDMPSDVAQDSINANPEHVLPHTEVLTHPRLTENDIIIGTDGTNQLQVTTTYQEFPQGATPFPPHIIKPPQFSTAPPLTIPIGTTLTEVPVCITFQFATPEPDPPRGDSI